MSFYLSSGALLDLIANFLVNLLETNLVPRLPSLTKAPQLMMHFFFIMPLYAIAAHLEALIGLKVLNMLVLSKFEAFSNPVLTGPGHRQET